MEKGFHPMFIASTVILSGLIAAQVVTRLAKGHFEEFRDLPRLPQES